MSVITGTPQTPGAAVSVFDATALAALDVSGMTIGTVAYVTSLALPFTLTTSTAGLVTNQIVAVAGVGGVRWIVAPTALATVTTDATLTGAGTAGSPLKVAVPVDPGEVQLLGSDATKVDFVVDGNANGDIELSGFIKLPSSGTPTYTIKLNDLATNQDTIIGVFDGATAASAEVANIHLSGISAAGGYVMFTVRIHSKTGKQRFIEIGCLDSADGTAGVRFLPSAAVWNDTSTNIVKVTLFCDTANAIKATSRIVRRYLGVST